MAKAHTYRTSLRWEGERKGKAHPPGLPELIVATPPQFPQGHEGLWSPEHLFVAAAEGCLMTTFLAMAESSRIEFREYSSEAEGTLEKTENGFMMTRIVIRPRVVISDESIREKTLRIVERAEKHCLISNSMKTEVHLEPEILVG